MLIEVVTPVELVVIKNSVLSSCEKLCGLNGKVLCLRDLSVRKKLFCDCGDFLGTCKYTKDDGISSTRRPLDFKS